MGIEFLWIALSVVIAVGAASRGRSFVAFLAVSLILSPVVGLVALFVMQPKTAEQREEAAGKRGMIFRRSIQVVIVGLVLGVGLGKLLVALLL